MNLDYEQTKNLLNQSNGKVALVNCDNFEYFNYDNHSWEKIDFGKVEQVPIFIYHHYDVNPKTNEEIYEFIYELMIPHVRVVPSHIERFIFSSDFSKEDPYSIKYTSVPNCDYDKNTIIPIRYNNENVFTLSRIKHEWTIYNYLKTNKKDLEKTIKCISKYIDIDYGKQKVKTKNTSV